MKKFVKKTVVICMLAMFCMSAHAKQLTHPTLPKFDKMLQFFPGGFDAMMKTAKHVKDIQVSMEQLRAVGSYDTGLLDSVIDKLHPTDALRAFENIKGLYTLVEKKKKEGKSDSDKDVSTSLNDAAKPIVVLLRDDFLTKTKTFFSFLFEKNNRDQFKPVIAESLGESEDVVSAKSKFILYRLCDLNPEKIEAYCIKNLNTPAVLYKLCKEIKTVVTDLYTSMPLARGAWLQAISQAKK